MTYRAVTPESITGDQSLMTSLSFTGLSLNNNAFNTIRAGTSKVT